MEPKITRRKIIRRSWGVALSSAAAAQTAAPAPDQLLAAARRQREGTRKTLDEFKLDRAVEPAFVFKA